ncbi:unnamed protein product [Phytophthora lilii]|uniref:Unnamed protein product n=1 Tax=Phytophthora lilii TaxID=2077276 RepID=A0A9W6XCA6_9STRA|nr:unnamed protein product [Phytophthora lilii]
MLGAVHSLIETMDEYKYLHGRGIVHQDLKCDNIPVGSDGRAKLADFGLPTNKTNIQLGAVRWKAPEQLTSGKCRPSKEADIYSFGMCIVQAVSGDIPWGQLPMLWCPIV